MTGLTISRVNMATQNIEIDLTWESLVGIWLINFLKLKKRERKEALYLLSKFGKDFFLFVYIFADKLSLDYDVLRRTINFFRINFSTINNLDIADQDISIAKLENFAGIKIDKNSKKIIVNV